MAITAESLMELILEAQKANEEVEIELAAVQTRLAALTKRSDALKAEEEAFRASFERRYPGKLEPALSTVPAAVARTSPENGWSTLSRTDSVQEAVKSLTEVKDFATPSEIENLLREKGRTDSRDNIGAALAYLNRIGKVHRRARAEWVHGKEL